MNNSNGAATVTKAKKKGVSFVARVNKVKTVKALNALLEKEKDFPYSNPKVRRRRRRAINEKFISFGLNVIVS